MWGVKIKEFKTRNQFLTLKKATQWGILQEI